MLRAGGSNMSLNFSHQPVLLQPCLDALNIRPGGVYVDGTAGGAGHSLAIAKRLTTGVLYAFDRDPDAAAVSAERLSGFSAAVVCENYSCMKRWLEQQGVSQVDGVLLDLGVSSYQLDDPDRGMSYLHDGALDMRMSKQGPSAADLIADASEQQLTRILREYGEEKYAPWIAKAIVRQREIAPIQTTAQLADVIAKAVPAKARRGKNPCRRSFQAIRIAVNDELGNLKKGLEDAFSLLGTRGRLAVITFHSLEDRIVKQYFASLCKGCICPPDFPVCVCGNRPKAKLVFRKPVLADEQELIQNRRSRSAKLRAIEKLG